MNRLLGTLLVTLALGCSNEVHEHGLAVRYVNALGTKSGALCAPPGLRTSAGGGTSVDGKKWNDLPNLWVKYHTSDDDSFDIDVTIVDAYRGETSVPAQKRVLFEKTYDSAFLASGAIDTFETPFEGDRYTFTFQGLKDGESCALEAGSENTAAGDE